MKTWMLVTASTVVICVIVSMLVAIVSYKSGIEMESANSKVTGFVECVETVVKQKSVDGGHMEATKSSAEVAEQVAQQIETATAEAEKPDSPGEVKEHPQAHGARLMASVPIERLTPAQAKVCERVQGEIWSAWSTNGHVEICVIPKAAGNGFYEKWAACQVAGGMPVRYGGLHILCGLSTADE